MAKWEWLSGNVRCLHGRAFALLFCVPLVCFSNGAHESARAGAAVGGGVASRGQPRRRVDVRREGPRHAVRCADATTVQCARWIHAPTTAAGGGLGRQTRQAHSSPGGAHALRGKGAVPSLPPSARRAQSVPSAGWGRRDFSRPVGADGTAAHGGTRSARGVRRPQCCGGDARAHDVLVGDAVHQLGRCAGGRRRRAADRDGALARGRVRRGSGFHLWPTACPSRSGLCGLRRGAACRAGTRSV